MKWLQTSSLTSSIVLSSVCAALSATVPGVVGDGRPSIYYVASTGEFGIQPDRQHVGMFYIESASGIFTAPAAIPPGGLGIDVNTNMIKGWVALPANAFTQDFSLGVIALPNIQVDVLLSDLAALIGRGFGAEKDNADLVYYAPANTPPRGVDALIGFPAAGPGVTFMHQFEATDAEDPMSSLVWSELQFNLDGPGTPRFQPTLSPTGFFTWDTTGSPRGVYTAAAIVTDSGGYRDMAVLMINTTPEPSAAILCSLAFAGLCAFIDRRR